VPRANGTAATAGVPSGVTISRSVFEGIGVLGKQSSALFISLACGVALLDSVLYSGPRAGVNIDDGFCGGHSIERSVLFDWVRESQCSRKRTPSPLPCAPSMHSRTCTAASLSCSSRSRTDKHMGQADVLHAAIWWQHPTVAAHRRELHSQRPEWEPRPWQPLSRYEVVAPVNAHESPP
jgi:hypothetical protein